MKSPNELWHIETNQKLIRWYFGVVDGFSRLPVVLECCNNNKAETILSCFLNGVSDFGFPIQVRSDKGKENVLVADYMISSRGAGRGSMLMSKSTHNQRIERLWKDVFHGVLYFFHSLFYFMEENGILDPLNNLYISLLFTTDIYLPIIMDKLNVWKSA